MITRAGVLRITTGTVLGLALVACADEPTAAGSAEGAQQRIQVATSTDVYGSVVRAVGGNRVSVTSFIDNPGADPEEYEAAPADAAAVEAAELVVGNGGGYDDFVFQLAEAAGGSRTVLDASDVSGLAEEVAAGEEFNEHVWFDLAAMQRLADRVATELGEISPQDRDAFTAGATSFNKDVEELKTKVAEVAKEFPGARVASTEPLPLYLVEDAGLQNATPEEFMEASEEGTDAPAAVVQETLELVTSDDPVRVLVLNVQTQTPATDRLRQAAEAAGVPEVEVFENLSQSVEDYVPWMQAQIDALTAALRQSA